LYQSGNCASDLLAAHLLRLPAAADRHREGARPPAARLGDDEPVSALDVSIEA
jgi:hypothetical protein